MQNRPLQLFASLLLAIRRAMTTRCMIEEPRSDRPVPLGCIGLQTLIAAWTADPTGWRDSGFMDPCLEVPGVGTFELFDPSIDEQLGSGKWTLRLNRRRLLTQPDGHSLGLLVRAIRNRTKIEYDKALDHWLQDDHEWVELGPAEWPRHKSRKFVLHQKQPVLPQDRDHAHYALHFDPIHTDRLQLSRDGVIWHRSDNPRVRQLYANLCQRPLFFATA